MHNDILKIYRIIQYFRNICKCNMVKKFFRMYKMFTFLLKKIVSAKFDFIHYAKIIFLSKTQSRLTCANMVFYFLNSMA